MLCAFSVGPQAPADGWAEAIAAYIAERNARSIDGLAAVDPPD
jgi:hypothetical protein